MHTSCFLLHNTYQIKDVCLQPLISAANGGGGRCRESIHIIVSSFIYEQPTLLETLLVCVGIINTVSALLGLPLYS